MGNRWAILAVLFLARVGLGFQFQTLGSVSDDLVEAFGLDYAEIGTLIGAFMLPGLFIALPAGFAGRFLSDRLLTASGLGLLALGGLVASLAEGFDLLGTGRILCGIGFTLTTIYFTKMIADWFVGKEIATALSVLVMSWPFGIALGQIAHEWLSDLAGWQSAFLAASSYCAVMAAAILALYRPPRVEGGGTAPATKITALFSRREFILTVFASLPWALFNAGYVVYLSFAPLMLTNGGYGEFEAAAMISLASWVMIFSGAVAGQITDRTGRPGLVLYSAMTVAAISLIILQWTDLALVSSLAFGLIGMAPAGVIMALTAESMRPENRAFGMGVFFSSYFLIVAPAPGIAGWIYDRTGDPFDAIVFGVALFILTALCHIGFKALKRLMPLAAETE